MGEVRKQFEVVGDFILSGAPIESIFEFKDTGVPPVRQIELPNGSVVPGPYVTIPGQQLILSDSLLSITDGNTVDLSLALNEIDIQTLSLSADSLSIARGNEIDLSEYKQTLEVVDGDQLSISSGNSVDLSSLNQTLSVSGTVLSISDGNDVDLGFLAEELDNQTLSLSDGYLQISNGNSVDLTAMSQTLSVSGTTLTISDGNSVDLGDLSDDLDNQKLSISGNVISLTNGGEISLEHLESYAPIFVTNVNNNNGLINREYVTDTVPANKIISGFTVDDDSNLDVTIEWDGPIDDWMGDVFINNQPVPTNTASQLGNTRRFTATVNVDLEGAETLSISGNGFTQQIPVTLLGGGPGVVDVQFGELPTYGGVQQAMFLDGDTVQVTATFDTVDVESITIYSGTSTATTSQTFNNVNVTDNGDGTSSYVFTATIDTSDTTVTNRPIQISAKNSFGTQGDTHTSIETIPVRKGAEITNVSFGSYPGIQTELKDNDTISVTLTFDTNNVSQVQFNSGGNYASAYQTKSVSVNNLIATITMTIDTNVTTPQQQSVQVRAKTSNGQYGVYHTSVDKLTVNNAGPLFSGFNASYPTNQSAVQSGDTADVTLNITSVGNSPTYTYSDPTGQLSIPDTTSYTATKTITANNSGVYNISSTNYRVVVVRAENNKSATYTNNIKVADVLPTLTVSGNSSSFRSGGDENTSTQTYQITVTSNQQLTSFNMDAAGSAGTFLGSWSGSNSNRTWTRNIQISDADTKGSFDFQNVAAINLANETQTSASNTQYTLAGFVQRSLTMNALSRTRALGTNVTDPTNITASETFRGAITFDNTIADGTAIDSDISTGIDIANKFTIVDSSDTSVVDYSGDTIFYLDRTAVNNNVSGTSVITIEETI